MNGTLLSFAALALVAVATGLWFRAALAVRLPDSRTPYIAAWFVGALLGMAALLAGVGVVGGIAAVLAAVSGSFLCVLVAISRQEAAGDVVKVGEPLRDFRATDEHDQVFELSSARGKPTLLKFFRGHW